MPLNSFPIRFRARTITASLVATRVMKKGLVAVAAIAVLIGTPALAADMAVKAPPPVVLPVPAYSWTGCYVNGGGGYGMWNQDLITETNPGLVQVTTPTTTGGRGWLGTVGGGCDYQFSAFNSNVVIGALADFDFMHIHGLNQPNTSGLVGDENEQSAWAVGGRAGYLVTPALLTYVSGGYTATRFGQINYGLSGAPFTPNVDFIQAHTYHGWFIGGGTEYALAWLPGLFWRNEYRYASYSSADLPIVVTATGALSGVGEHMTPYVQTITTELVYKFNWSGPVSAKY